MSRSSTFGVIIIGSGAAGLSVALSLPKTLRIAILSKGPLTSGASPYAQGGIAAVINNHLDIDAHIQDTLDAGAGLCDLDAVTFTVTQGQAAIEWLIAQGVVFNMTPSQQLEFTREGGHSARRIIHAADKTGSVVIKTLADQVKDQPNILCFDHHTAIDLILEDGCCQGVTTLRNKTNKIHALYAQKTLLATGGTTQAYLHNTNPENTSGDGIAMAYRANANISHMEFMQFHPTCLYAPNTPPFLITEAIRGEGALLRRHDGERFMHRYDARAELAPRDIVSRAIHAEMQALGTSHVFLDATHINTDKLTTHFPTIYAHCLSLDIDITKHLIPVAPAAHYTCGGITTDLHGLTNIPHLYAIGETAYTGLHGANRLASNSLLECLVFAMSASQHIQQHITANTASTHAKPQRQYNNTQPAPTYETNNLKHRIQTLMSEHAGIIRTHHSLATSKQALQHISQQIASLYQSTQLTKDLIELRNLACAATLIVEHAIQRKTNCGLHYNKDLCNNTPIHSLSVQSKQS